MSRKVIAYNKAIHAIKLAKQKVASDIKKIKQAEAYVKAQSNSGKDEDEFYLQDQEMSGGLMTGPLTKEQKDKLEAFFKAENLEYSVIGKKEWEDQGGTGDLDLSNWQDEIG